MNNPIPISNFLEQITEKFLLRYAITEGTEEALKLLSENEDDSNREYINRLRNKIKELNNDKRVSDPISHGVPDTVINKARVELL